MITAFDAHNNAPVDKRTDKAGVPYIYHPIHVAYQMETEDEICVALLHDVVEDTNVTLNDLRDKGFPERIIASLRLLTKEKSSSKDENLQYKEYMEYINNLKHSGNEVAIKVKLADLNHNCDEKRLSSLADEERERIVKYNIAKYKEAISILKSTK